MVKYITELQREFLQRVVVTKHGTSRSDLLVLHTTLINGCYVDGSHEQDVLNNVKKRVLGV